MEGLLDRGDGSSGGNTVENLGIALSINRFIFDERKPSSKAHFEYKCNYSWCDEPDKILAETARKELRAPHLVTMEFSSPVDYIQLDAERAKFLASRVLIFRIYEFTDRGKYLNGQQQPMSPTSVTSNPSTYTFEKELGQVVACGTVDVSMFLHRPPKEYAVQLEDNFTRVGKLQFCITVAPVESSFFHGKTKIDRTLFVSCERVVVENPAGQHLVPDAEYHLQIRYGEKKFRSPSVTCHSGEVLRWSYEVPFEDDCSENASAGGKSKKIKFTLYRGKYIDASFAVDANRIHAMTPTFNPTGATTQGSQSHKFSVPMMLANGGQANFWFSSYYVDKVMLATTILEGSRSQPTSPKQPPPSVEKRNAKRGSNESPYKLTPPVVEVESKTSSQNDEQKQSATKKGDNEDVVPLSHSSSLSRNTPPVQTSHHHNNLDANRPVPLKLDGVAVSSTATGTSKSPSIGVTPPPPANLHTSKHQETKDEQKEKQHQQKLETYSFPRSSSDLFLTTQNAHADSAESSHNTNAGVQESVKSRSPQPPSSPPAIATTDVSVSTQQPQLPHPYSASLQQDYVLFLQEQCHSLDARLGETFSKLVEKDQQIQCLQQQVASLSDVVQKLSAIPQPALGQGGVVQLPLHGYPMTTAQQLPTHVPLGGNAVTTVSPERQVMLPTTSVSISQHRSVERTPVPAPNNVAPFFSPTPNPKELAPVSQLAQQQSVLLSVPPSNFLASSGTGTETYYEDEKISTPSIRENTNPQEHQNATTIQGQPTHQSANTLDDDVLNWQQLRSQSAAQQQGQWGGPLRQPPAPTSIMSVALPQGGSGGGGRTNNANVAPTPPQLSSSGNSPSHLPPHQTSRSDHPITANTVSNSTRPMSSQPQHWYAHDDNNAINQRSASYQSVNDRSNSNYQPPLSHHNVVGERGASERGSGGGVKLKWQGGGNSYPTTNPGYSQVTKLQQRRSGDMNGQFSQPPQLMLFQSDSRPSSRNAVNRNS